MTSRPCDNPVYAVVAAEPLPELARMALRKGWPIVCAALAQSAFREIRWRRPTGVLAQISLRNAESVALVRSLRTAPAPLPVVAVADGHHAQLELAARDAGASCYVADPSDEATVERAVRDILGRADGATPREARTCIVWKPMESEPSPFLLLQYVRGGGLLPPAAPRTVGSEGQTGVIGQNWETKTPFLLLQRTRDGGSSSPAVPRSVRGRGKTCA
jgi:CheY-like chemotaxis protein